MWIEKGDVRLVSPIEIKTSAGGREYAVGRAGFPAPKDSPRDTPRVWFGLTIFADDLSGVRGLDKGDSITFKGKLESNTYTKRDGTVVTEPRLIISEVFEAKKSDFNNQETRQAIGSVGRKYGNQAAPVNKTSALDILPDVDEELPF